MTLLQLLDKVDFGTATKAEEMEEVLGALKYLNKEKWAALPGDIKETSLRLIRKAGAQQALRGTFMAIFINGPVVLGVPYELMSEHWSRGHRRAEHLLSLLRSQDKRVV